MPRRSARNVGKENQGQEKPQLEPDKTVLITGVVEVIDEFVAAAEHQEENLEDQDDASKSNDVDVDSNLKETKVIIFV